MRKVLYSGTAITFILVLMSLPLFAHTPASPEKETVEVEGKKIEKGISLEITSSDPEVVKELQEDLPWYRRMLQHMFSGGWGMKMREMMHSMMQGGGCH